VVAVAVVFASISLCSELAAEIELISGGYVRVRLDGVYLVERKFQAGLQEVRLTGMMHIAEKDFYSAVLPKADPNLPSVVLVEGVTDSKGLLSRRGIRYSHLARLLNVTSQEESEFTSHVINGLREEEDKRHDLENSSKRSFAKTEDPPKPDKAGGIDFIHADVDVATFHPTTIAFLITVMGIFQSDDLRSVFRTLADPNSPLSDENAQRLVMDDILHSRNDKLMDEIQESLKKYRRVIVPWGALHLSDIESRLRAQNFEQNGEIERKALAFW
jgi:hypothetical protein